MSGSFSWDAGAGHGDGLVSSGVKKLQFCSFLLIDEPQKLVRSVVPQNLIPQQAEVSFRGGHVDKSHSHLKVVVQGDIYGR